MLESMVSTLPSTVGKENCSGRDIELIAALAADVFSFTADSHGDRIDSWFNSPHSL